MALLAAIFAPLRDLLRQYDAVATAIGGVTAGIEDILAAQEPGVTLEPLAAAQEPGVTLEPLADSALPPTSVANPPALLQVEIGAASADAILAFTDGLGSLPGVRHVTVAGATGARTTFLVELAPHDAPAPGPTVVCIQCLRVLVPGGTSISHGLCPDCLEPFVAQAAMSPESIAEGRTFGQR